MYRGRGGGRFRKPMRNNEPKKGNKMVRHIGCRLQVIMLDGTVYKGLLKAFDKFMNLILDECQFVSSKDKKEEETRTAGGGNYGLVLMRGEQIVSLTVVEDRPDSRGQSQRGYGGGRGRGRGFYQDRDQGGDMSRSYNSSLNWGSDSSGYSEASSRTPMVEERDRYQSYGSGRGRGYSHYGASDRSEHHGSYRERGESYHPASERSQHHGSSRDRELPYFSDSDQSLSHGSDRDRGHSYTDRDRGHSYTDRDRYPSRGSGRDRYHSDRRGYY